MVASVAGALVSPLGLVVAGIQAKIGARTAAGQEDLAKIGAEWEGKIQELDRREAGLGVLVDSIRG